MMLSMNDIINIEHAINLLRAEAKGIQECHTPIRNRSNWTGEEHAKRAFTELRRTAAGLERILARHAKES